MFIQINSFDELVEELKILPTDYKINLCNSGKVTAMDVNHETKVITIYGENYES